MDPDPGTLTTLLFRNDLGRLEHQLLNEYMECKAGCFHSIQAKSDAHLMGDEETAGPSITCSPLASHLVKHSLSLRCAQAQAGC